MNSKKVEISRVHRTKSDAKEYYDKLSKYYDFLSGNIEHKLNKFGLQKLEIEKDDVFLEIGYGTGKILREILNLDLYSGKLYGIDLSEGMKKRALQRFNETEDQRINLIVGDAKTLPYENEKFDKVFMSFTLELFDTPEIPMVLKECIRVLKNNGKICVISMSKKNQKIMERIYEWAHKKFPKQIDCRPIYTKKIIEESGFEIEEHIEKTMFGLPVDIVIAKNKS